MYSRITKALTRDETAFTLVELLIASLVSVIILGFVGALMLNSVQSSSVIGSRNQVNVSAQQIAQQIQESVRNATALQISTPATTAVSIAGSQLLVVDTQGLNAAATELCRAFLYLPSGGGQLFYRSTSVPSSGPNTQIFPSGFAASLASGLAASPIVPPSGWSSYGNVVAATGTWPTSGTSAIFAPTSGANGLIQINFKVVSSQSPAVVIATSAQAGQIPTGTTYPSFTATPYTVGSSTCFP